MKSASKSQAGKIEAVATHASASSALLTLDDLKILRAPFPKDSLGVKVQSLSKERTRAMLVLYLQHTDVQDRLEQVDPAWTLEVISEDRVGDTVYVRMKMTVKGVSRENVGEGGDPKAAYSDALKRCAMLFGVGRYLYDSDTVWANYDESKDRYKQWSIEDYDAALQRQQGYRSRAAAQAPASSVTTSGPGRAATPAASETGASAGVVPGLKKASARSRDQLNRILMNLYRPYLTKFPETRFVELLQSRYNVGETRLMTIEQIEDLVQYMEQQLKSVA